MTLALLMTAATGAWADWTGGTYTATTNEELGAITVGADATLTINEGVTVTVKGGINANGHTLTVNGAGTLTVTGTNGADGANGGGFTGGGGGIGSAGFTGTLIVDGATVNVTGGNGGNGGTGLSDGGRGGNGAAGVSGSITLNSGSATVTGGAGGNGANGNTDLSSDGGSGGNGAAGVSGSITLNSGSATVTGGAGGNGGHGGLRDGSRGSAGQAVTETITASTVEESDDNSTWTAISGNTSSKRYVRAESTAPDVEVTTNAAQAGDFFTEASFDMPAFDATVGYDIVRDLAQQTSVNLIIGTGDAATPVTADTRLRIQKVNNVYAPVSALSCTFTDAIENKTILPTGFDDAKLTPLFYKQGENDAWTLVTDINTTTKLPNNLQPGQVYCITLKAADGSYYDGETPQSFTVTLFEGYEVKVPAGEYITYYRDEPLKLDDNETNAELYTISAVGTETATLSGPYDAMKALTPMLVHNKNTEEAKTILLIPCNEPDLALTVAPEFKGTLEATEIAASSATSNNYAFNGKKFVWVMNDLEIGANKAWLSISATSGARVINLVFDDATRIDGVARTAEQSGDYYDLNGRKLAAKPTRKGVYIQNGKKVVVK